MRRGPTRHPFIEDPEDPGYCWRCHLPEINAIHNMPEISDEQRAAEARRTGDRT